MILLHLSKQDSLNKIEEDLVSTLALADREALVGAGGELAAEEEAGDEAAASLGAVRLLPLPPAPEAVGGASDAAGGSSSAGVDLP